MQQSESQVAVMTAGSFAGIADIIESFRRVTLWSTLGWYDFASRYQRTILGPLWQTLIVGIWVAGLGFVFGRLLGRSSEDYPAYLACGVVLWNYLSSTLSGSTKVFVKNAKLIYAVNNPLYTYVLRQIIENSARLAFQALVIAAVLAFTNVPFGLGTLMAIPGLALIFFTSLWLVPLMGILGARFRDLSFALTSIMRFMFFTTPVFWRADGLGARAHIANYNPFTHFLAIVRTPLLGGTVPLASWSIVLAITVSGALLTLVVYNRFRRRIVFWL